ncbi:hypothetical protein D3C87_1989860 [compost metagenome]
MSTRGHDIVEKMKKVYAVLSPKYEKEGALQNALIPIMAKCYPFVPQTSVDLIKAIRIK